MAARRPERRLWLELLHVAGLVAFALTEPIYRLIAKNPQFLAAHAATRGQLAILLLVLSVLVPLVVAAIELAALAAGGRARAVLHLGLVGLLASFFAVQMLMRLWPSGGGRVLVALAAAAGAAFALGYARSAVVYGFTTFLCVAAVVSPLAFLLDDRTEEFLRGTSRPEVMTVDVGNPVPLVIVIFDELPVVTLLDQRLGIDAGLYPSFARLAAMSHWFRDATTTGSHTDLSVPALHTGNYTPTERLVPMTLENYPRNLFTLLGATYQVHALEHLTHFARALENEGALGFVPDRGGPLLLLADVAAIALHVVTPPPWSARLPRLDVGWTGFWRPAEKEGAEERTAAPPDRMTEVRAFLAALEPGQRPPLVYLHSLFPHFPWEHLPSGRRYYDATLVPGLLRDDLWSDDEWLIAQAYQRLRIQVQAVDRLLGEILDRLERLGWLDDSVLVLVSDHGHSFAPGAPRRDLLPEHSDILRAEIMPIPLFVKLPGQREGLVHDEAAEMIDVLPTIARALEVEVPWSMEGRPLLDPGAPERTERRLQLRDPFVTLRFEEGAAAVSPLEELAQRRNRWFAASPAGGYDLYRFGPDAALIGQRVVDTAATPGLVAVIHHEHLFREVAAHHHWVPAFVTGEIEPLAGSTPTLHGAAIAIGVDGVVRATTRTYASASGAIAFAALLPEEALPAGAHRVDVFLVERAANGGPTALARIETRGRQDTLRDSWTGSPDTLFRADATTGWSGFEGLNHTRVAPTEEGLLEIMAAGGVPLVDLPAFDAGGSDSVVVAIEIECADELTPRLRYMTAADQAFRPRRFVQTRIREGRATAFLEISDPDLIGRLSLDLGRTSSPALLHSLEVRRAGRDQRR